MASNAFVAAEEHLLTQGYEAFWTYQSLSNLNGFDSNRQICLAVCTFSFHNDLDRSRTSRSFNCPSTGTVYPKTAITYLTVTSIPFSVHHASTGILEDGRRSG